MKILWLMVITGNMNKIFALKDAKAARAGHAWLCRPHELKVALRNFLTKNTYFDIIL